MKTGIRRTFDGNHQVWFSIDHQTFVLNETNEETKEDSLEIAQFQEKQLKIALKRFKKKSYNKGFKRCYDKIWEMIKIK